MIRPCDQCHGIGVLGGYVDLAETELAQSPCPRCTDMPWLTLWQFPDRHAEAISKGHGPQQLKPDPDTVMRWCQAHGSRFPTGGPECNYAYHYNLAHKALMDLPPCHADWIETPTPLTTTTIRQTPNHPTKKNH